MKMASVFRVPRELVISGIIIFSVFAQASADTILLKSGKQVDGKIVEKTDQYLAINSNNRVLYYERKYVKSFNEDQGADLSTADTENKKSVNQDSGEKPAVEKTDDIKQDLFLREGLRLAASGDLENAKREVNLGLEANKDDENLLSLSNTIDRVNTKNMKKEDAIIYFKGLSALFEQDYTQAVNFLNQAFKVDPRNADVCYNLGIAYGGMEDYEKSITYLLKALDIDPDDAEIYGYLGRMYYLAGSDYYRKAIKTWRLARLLFVKKGDKVNSEAIKQLLSQFSEPDNSRPLQ